MFITCKLKKGENFKTAMKKHGVKDWNTTWNLPQNKTLRSKRKYADKVEAGDTLVILDPKATLRTVDFLGKTYTIPDAEWDAVKRDIVKSIQKKFLPKLLALKKAYDDDYNFMWNLANGSGVLTGMLAAAVENLTGATVPTTEMSAVSKAVSDVDKAIRKADFASIVLTMGSAEKAMKAYVKAAEAYRKKMTDGSTEGVEFLEITRDGCFIVATALATGGAGAAVKTVAFSAVEIGAAMSAGGALVKVASGEVGEYLAGNERSASEIAYTVVRDTMLGAATGAFGGFVMQKFGGYLVAYLAKHVKNVAPRVVIVMLRKDTIPGGKFGNELIKQLGEEEVARLIVATVLRSGGGWANTALIEYFKTKAGIDALVDAASSVMKGTTGSEKEQVIGDKIGAKLADDDIAAAVIAATLKKNESAIQKALSSAQSQAA